jgi:hypothetical protein
MTATAPQWEDCTTYSQGDKDRIPTTWAIQSGGVRIVVTKGHITWRGHWIMHCRALGIDTKPLATGITKEQAQRQAITIVQSKALDILQNIEAMR